MMFRSRSISAALHARANGSMPAIRFNSSAVRGDLVTMRSSVAWDTIGAVDDPAPSLRVTSLLKAISLLRNILDLGLSSGASSNTRAGVEASFEVGLVGTASVGARLGVVVHDRAFVLFLFK